MSPCSFSPEIQYEFSGDSSQYAGLYMFTNVNQLPWATSRWLRYSSSPKSWRSRNRSPICRAALSPSRTNRESSGAGPCLTVSASGNRRLFSGIIIGVDEVHRHLLRPAANAGAVRKSDIGELRRPLKRTFDQARGAIPSFTIYLLNSQSEV